MVRWARENRAEKHGFDRAAWSTDGVLWDEPKGFTRSPPWRGDGDGLPNKNRYGTSD